jgi:peptidoglycan/LPS O-acetylase OafA/YrhL
MAAFNFWTALANSIGISKMRPVSVKRNLVLDGLRGTAVILVIFHHLKLINKDAFQFPLFKAGRYLLTPLVRGGWIGVDLFFVLSGFLVSGLLFYEFKKTSAVNPARFLVRRAFKIYPLFIVFLFTTFLLEKIYSYYHPEVSYPVWSYIKDLLFIENYTGGRFAHTWSLDVEEFFYLVLILFFVILARKRMVNLKQFRLAFLTLLLLCITGRVISVCLSAGDDSFYLKTHTRLDAMFFGVLLSYLYHFEKNRLDIIRKHATILTIGCFLFCCQTFSLDGRIPICS